VVDAVLDGLVVGLSYLLPEVGPDPGLLGGPGEDRASVDASFALAEALCPEALKIAVSVRIYPGTAMARLAVREAVISPADDLLAPVFYTSEAARDWLPQRARDEARSHPGWRL